MRDLPVPAPAQLLDGLALPAHHQKLPELCESVPDTLCGVICLQNFSRKAALGPSFLEHLC